MTRVKAGSTVRYTITYLEMTTRPTTDVPDLPETTQLVPAINPPAWYFMSLYDAVGRDYEWQDKHFEDPTEVAAFVGDPKVSLFTLMQDGWPQGFFQLDWRTPGTCDLAYFRRLWARDWAGSCCILQLPKDGRGMALHG
jgi:hypothetical protein